MLLDVNWPFLASTLYKAPNTTADVLHHEGNLGNTCTTLTVQLAFRFEGNDLVLSFKIFYPRVTHRVTHLVCPPRSSYLRAVSEGVFLPGRSWSNHSPGAAPGREDEVAAKLSQILGI